MKKKYVIGIVTVVLSLIVCTVTLNDVTPQQEEKPKTTEIPIESLSHTGNLSRYELKLNCPLPEVKSAPILNIASIPISNETATEISQNVFNLEKIGSIKKMPWNGISIEYENKNLEFFGLDHIYYSEEDISPVIETWDKNEILKIADDFLQVMNEYWIYETEVKEEFESIKPCWTTIEVYLEKIEETEIIHAIGVNYRLKVDNFELVGPGADFSIWVAEGRIISVELHKPSIDIIGHQNITKTAEEAIENFISGKSDVRKLGFEDISGRTPREGVCSIDNVKLVYYVGFAKELQDNLPLVYEINGKLTYVDPSTGETVDSDFTDYQIATN